MPSHGLRVLALALLGALALSAAGRAEPFVPGDDAAVLERLPSAGNPWLDDLRDQRTALAQNPDDLGMALALATAYVRLGHREADPRYDGYAQAALAPWWDLAEPPIAVLILRATLRQRQHDFDGALGDLDRVLARSPRHPQAWLMKATILGVQGEPEGALMSCARLAGRVEVLVEAACAAVAYGLGRRAPDGYRLLQGVLGASPDAAPELRVWALTILAELAAQRSDGEAAEAHFQAALALDRRDPYLLGAYADFLLDDDRPAEALALLDGETRIDPFTLDLLGRPAAALELALANWAMQREPADARVLLEAALAAGDAAAAMPVLEWLDRIGLDHARIRALADQVRGAV
jgi:tetratricopeptide (TPR) repeat protein